MDSVATAEFQSKASTPQCKKKKKLLSNVQERTVVRQYNKHVFLHVTLTNPNQN